MKRLFWLFQPLAIPKADGWTAPVLVDEFDAGQLQGPPNRQTVSDRHGLLARLVLPEFEPIILASFRGVSLENKPQCGQLDFTPLATAKCAPGPLPLRRPLGPIKALNPTSRVLNRPRIDYRNL
jgi:hypothetical protein